MANYGYGSGYTTTTYGAQGGADGGGFVHGGYGGSQGGSQDNPSSKTYGKETLRPVTVKQMIDAEQPYPDAEFKIDGIEVTQISFVGQIHSVSKLATNITYKLDDGTGLIEVKQWIDSDADPESVKTLPDEGQYLHVWGRLKSFNDKRHVGARIIRTITDYNEISMHLLEATVVHLYFIRGSPNGGATKTEGGDNMFVDSHGARDIGATNGERKLPAKLSATAKKMFHVLQSAPQNNEGLHAHNIAQQIGINMQEIFPASDELLHEGLIYTTVDDETWAVLEY